MEKFEFIEYTAKSCGIDEIGDFRSNSLFPKGIKYKNNIVLANLLIFIFNMMNGNYYE